MLARLILRVVGTTHLSRRGLASALYINNFSKEQAILFPNKDWSEKFKDIDKLKENLKRRMIQKNAEELRDLWEFYRDLNEVRETLEEGKTELNERVKAAIAAHGSIENNEEAEALMCKVRLLKEDLRNLMDSFIPAEEKMMTSFLLLPNDLHPRTPEVTNVVLHDRNSGMVPKCEHLSSGKDLIDYRGPPFFYLKNAAVFFDMALMYYFLNGVKASGYKSTVGTDFAHDALVEGCAGNPLAVLGLENEEKMNLVGGPSIYSFCAYYARQRTKFRFLPGKHVAAGKKYIRNKRGTGLFGAWQRTCVDFFSISHAVDVENILDNAIKNLQALYDELGWDYRIELISAPELEYWESLRVSFQMQALHGWVEVGSISVSGTFFSERISMLIKAKDMTNHYGHVVSGTAVDVTSVLACILEQEENLFPKCIKPYTFGL